VNGVLDGSLTTPSPSRPTTSRSGSALRATATPDGSSRERSDEIRLYNRALSASAIQALASGVVGVGTPRPTGTLLAGAYPNPFQTSTTISFHLAQAGPVKLAVYGHRTGGRSAPWRAVAGRPVSTR
jgi:hypothetical protein